MTPSTSSRVWPSTWRFSTIMALRAGRGDRAPRWHACSDGSLAIAEATGQPATTRRGKRTTRLFHLGATLAILSYRAPSQITLAAKET
jgi:hypothetical protein